MDFIHQDLWPPYECRLQILIYAVLQEMMAWA